MSTDSVGAIIVAGGSGTRLGAQQPKAFVPLGEKPLFAHSLQTFLTHPLISTVVLVVATDMLDHTHQLLAELSLPAEPQIVTGGEHRWNSVHNGARALGTEIEWALVHDAARPFCTHAVIDSLLQCRTRYRAVVTATAMVDTVRTFSGDCAGETLDRTKLVRIGTPQLFHLLTLLEGFEHAQQMAYPPTDEAMLFEQMNIAVGIAWGDPNNFKVTTPADLQLARALYDAHPTM
jgi:2-C-methyl-D-erythritol 4-phosphate cytidylyltransferase